jgi:peptidoglycan/LPS O-acetylase OafA/YrhL
VFRTDALALGVLLALWSRHSSYELFKPVALGRFRAGLAGLVGALLCMSVLGSDQLHNVSIKIGMIALVSALLVWVASYNHDYLGMPRPLSSVLIWLGARSYGIYLIHIPAFFFTRELWYRLRGGVEFGPELFYPFLLAATTLIVLLCELNYRLVEAPLRRKGKLIAARMQSATLDRPE